MGGHGKKKGRQLLGREKFMKEASGLGVEQMGTGNWQFLPACRMGLGCQAFPDVAAARLQRMHASFILQSKISARSARTRLQVESVGHAKGRPEDNNDARVRLSEARDMQRTAHEIHRGLPGKPARTEQRLFDEPW